MFKINFLRLSSTISKLLSSPIHIERKIYRGHGVPCQTVLKYLFQIYVTANEVVIYINKIMTQEFALGIFPDNYECLLKQRKRTAYKA